MSIVERIREQCTQNGYTIAALERDTHIANGTISRWGESRFYADNLYKVAEKLHTSMDYLYSGEEIQNNHSISPAEQEWIFLYRELSSCDPELLRNCIAYIKGSIKGYQISNDSSNSN